MKAYTIISRIFALVVAILGGMHLFYVNIIDKKVLDILFLVICFLVAFDY